MDIKLVKNFEEGEYISVNEQLLLQIIDDDYSLGKFGGKKMFMLNPTTNEKYEILPDIKKYDIFEISYASLSHDYIVFTTADKVDSDKINVCFYQYSINDDNAVFMYEITENLNDLGSCLNYKVFVLDNNYTIFEKIFFHFDTDKSLIGSGEAYDYEVVLKDISREKQQVISNSVIARSGINSIFPLGGNTCAIKIGESTIKEMMLESVSLDSKNDELVGIVNVNQFISELALDLENPYIEILDESDENVTFPYIRQYDDDIVYSKVNVEKKIEEVVIYNNNTKVKKVRLNNNIERLSDLKHTYIISDTPYVISNSDKYTKLVNLNTQKTEVKLNADIRIRYIKNDLIIAQKHVKKGLLFKNESDSIQVFRYPDMDNPIFNTRAKYKYCVTHFDDLLIFTN